MNVIIFIISTSILLTLVILHSYLTRGLRITVNFFIFAFALMFNKEVFGTMQYGITKPYLFLTEDNPMILGQLTTVFGWMMTFYLSWCLSERILLRFSNFKGRLFTTLAFSIIVTMSISFCLENFGAAMGLWYWYYYSPSLEPFFINCVNESLRGWMHMCLMFLLPFFMIECSKYKSSGWKTVFFFIPLMYLWITPFVGIKYFTLMLDFVGINIIFFAFFVRLKIESSAIGYLNPSSRKSRYINQIPFIVLGLMLLFIAICESFFLKAPSLLVTTLPLLVIFILAIRKIPLFYVVILSLVIFSVFKTKAAIFLIPTVFALILWLFNKKSLSLNRGILSVNPILKKVYFVFRIIAYCFLSYQLIGALILLQNTPRYPKVLMTAYKGPTVSVSGNIIFNDYKGGFVNIVVYAKDPRKDNRFIIILKTIHDPGFYEFTVPKRIGKIYLAVASVDMRDPGYQLSFNYGDKSVIKSLKVVAQDIKGFDIDMSKYD